MPPIHERIREDLLLKERAFWTALTSADPAHAVNKLCAPNANLLFPNRDILALDEAKEGALDDALAPPFHRFDDFALQDVRVIVLDLMAGVVTYRVTAQRGKQEYRATASTTWSQGSDGEWEVAVHVESLL